MARETSDACDSSGSQHQDETPRASKASTKCGRGRPRKKLLPVQSTMATTVQSGQPQQRSQPKAQLKKSSRACPKKVGHGRAADEATARAKEERRKTRQPTDLSFPQPHVTVPVPTKVANEFLDMWVYCGNWKSYHACWATLRTAGGHLATLVKLPAYPARAPLDLSGESPVPEVLGSLISHIHGTPYWSRDSFPRNKRLFFHAEAYYTAMAWGLGDVCRYIFLGLANFISKVWSHAERRYRFDDLMEAVRIVLIHTVNMPRCVLRDLLLPFCTDHFYELMLRSMVFRTMIEEDSRIPGFEALVEMKKTYVIKGYYPKQKLLLPQCTNCNAIVSLDGYSPHWDNEKPCPCCGIEKDDWHLDSQGIFFEDRDVETLSQAKQNHLVEAVSCPTCELFVRVEHLEHGLLSTGPCPNCNSYVDDWDEQEVIRFIHTQVGDEYHEREKHRVQEMRQHVEQGQLGHYWRCCSVPFRTPLPELSDGGQESGSD